MKDEIVEKVIQGAAGAHNQLVANNKQHTYEIEMKAAQLDGIKKSTQQHKERVDAQKITQAKLVKMIDDLQDQMELVVKQNEKLEDLIANSEEKREALVGAYREVERQQEERVAKRVSADPMSIGEEARLVKIELLGLKKKNKDLKAECVEVENQEKSALSRVEILNTQQLMLEKTIRDL
eukprot:TRINITY_DN9902_c1_g1_i1.p2 TRINITY_DN9902_c1_g1~~TRINITY_DN9902_c1_g1_i1.p2  ORF type:complete len:180 (+),score=55.32 TRINITY_DN9902_c1_g1_i1:28-567(+)